MVATPHVIPQMEETPMTKIVRHYTEDDLRDDLRYAEGRQ